MLETDWQHQCVQTTENHKTEINMVTESRLSGTPMEKAPEPELGTELIPAERYTSEEYRQLEWDRMWTKAEYMTP